MVVLLCGFELAGMKKKWRILGTVIERLYGQACNDHTSLDSDERRFRISRIAIQHKEALLVNARCR
ncbi:MAG: hypothetical protein DRR42_01725 [Gammaproteobacteria bacterium]|nr:MAG: hypothetical protein DRR42_01725 [Gammaproteobacteria bacterium]